MKEAAKVLARSEMSFPDGKKFYRYTLVVKGEKGSVIGSVSSNKVIEEGTTVYLDWKSKVINQHECIVPFIL